jgi:hypothetical protein
VFSLAALVLALIAASALLAWKLWLAVGVGALSAWCASQAMRRKDDLELMLGLFLMAIVGVSVVRLAYAVLS